MYNRLMSFVLSQKILTEYQFGFQANKSTELAINEICDNINNAFESKESALCIFFAKAFDTVNHDVPPKTFALYCQTFPTSMV